MDSMNKALDAVGTLAALVEALRKPAQDEDGMITISRDEYESLVCNQTAPPDAVAVPAVAESTFVDRGSIDITKEHRWGILDATSGKPARVLVNFDRFPWNEEDDSMGNLFAGKEIALRNTDCVRVYVPYQYDKELVIKSLLEIADFVKSSWEHLSKDAADLAIACHSEDVKAARLEKEAQGEEAIPF